MFSESVTRYLDLGSAVVITLTLILFITSLFIKGFSHEVLLEAGVFLVSAKLVIMTRKNGVLADLLRRRLDEIQDTLRRLENSPR